MATEELAATTEEPVVMDQTNEAATPIANDERPNEESVSSQNTIEEPVLDQTTKESSTTTNEVTL